MKHIDNKVEKLQTEVDKLKDSQMESSKNLQQIQIGNSENIVDAS